MAKEKQSQKTIVEIIKENKNELLATWVKSIISQSGTQTKALIPEQKLKKQAADALTAITVAFGAEQFEDLSQPEFADAVSLMHEISASRAVQGFAPSETASFVFSLKYVLLEYLQKELGDQPELLNVEIIKVNNLIDKLGLITFETFAITLEKMIFEQTETLTELATPIIQLWDEIILLPLVGIVDTKRSQQIVENLLKEIVEYQAVVAILDVTGVPIIDTRVAQHLIQTVTAAKMLGTEVIITGFSPHVAQTLVMLNMDLGSIRTSGTLKAGVAEALRIIGKQITTK